jgi:hypothetical protein
MAHNFLIVLWAADCGETQAAPSQKFEREAIGQGGRRGFVTVS